MGAKPLAVLVAVAFSVVGVLGDYFLKLASERPQPFRTGWLPRLRALRLDRVRLGVRDEVAEAGDDQRPLFRVHDAVADGDRRGAVP
jgi:hypothetical protein